VKAYVAIAGRHHITDSDRGPGKVLHSHHIVAYVIHAEGDAVVPVQHSRDLVRYLEANQVKNESLFVPGSNHSIPPELRAQVRGIVRRECCGGT
jgi:predicted esterase